MKPRHVVMDRNTGEAWIQARDGTMYSPDELEAIERRAAAGDEAAGAIIESLDVTGITPAQMLHDCPECRAAMALGEVPTILGPDEIAAMRHTVLRDPARLDPALRDAALLDAAMLETAILEAAMRDPAMRDLATRELAMLDDAMLDDAMLDPARPPRAAERPRTGRPMMRRRPFRRRHR
jgi:hypothetical protein